MPAVAYLGGIIPGTGGHQAVPVATVVNGRLDAAFPERPAERNTVVAFVGPDPARPAAAIANSDLVHGLQGRENIMGAGLRGRGRDDDAVAIH